MNVVLVMFKDNQRRDFPLTDARTILGRRQDCHLRIPPRDVSRQHCEILLEKHTLRARDLGSANGTFVNGKRVAEVELKAGDKLRLGPVTFFVQIDGQPAKIDAPAPAAQSSVAPNVINPGADEKTFDLSEADFDLDDRMSALDKADDEADMP